MEWFEEFKKVVDQKGVVLTPTDTVWGLSATALDDSVGDKIYDIKQRRKSKSFIVLMHSLEQLQQYVLDDIQQVQTYLDSPRPTTIIYQNIKNLPNSLLADDGSLGIRIPKEQWLIDLLTYIQIPIISTSANLSGEPTPIALEDVSSSVKKTVDYIVPFQPKATGLSSQILKVDNGEPIWIRK